MYRRIAYLFFLSLSVSACGSGSFVGKRFDNFTAYYNKFYNARKSFDSGYRNIQRPDDPIDRDRFIPLFVRPSGNSTVREFDNAIKKSADVLREHPDSKWVDDALLLIGKSYFYQEAFVGALQKFREVVDMQTDLENEGRFWLARTLITSGSLDEAFEELQESLGREDVPGKWRGLFQLALGELHVVKSEWLLAANALSTGLEHAKDKEIAGRARFLLGQVYETMGRYDDAVEAYNDVRKSNPVYELSYAARISAIRVAGMHGDDVRALKELRKMERDDKNYDYGSELAFFRARILQSAGYIDEAFDVYHEILYDERPMSNLGKVKGRIHYALGELYRDIDHDYIMAAAYFDTAAASLQRPAAARSGNRTTSTIQYSSEAIVDLEELKANFGGLASVSKDVARMDSLLWLGRMDQEEFDTKLLEIRKLRAEKLEAQRKLREERERQQQFQQTATADDPFLNRGLPPGKVIPTLGDPTGRASGFLFHRDPSRLQDGQSNFRLKWGDRPMVPNWRRLSAISGSGVGSVVSETETTDDEAALGKDELPEVDISSVPRDSVSQVRMESTLAVARYELGNRLFLAMGRPDSAVVWYRRVVEENAEEPVAKRALYALAEVQKALGDSLSAERIYNRILEADPESDFAVRIRRQRGSGEEIVESDSSAVADAHYERVFATVETDSSEAGIDGLLRVVASYPGMDVRARALLAAGRLHMLVARSDTTILFGPVPTTVSDSILAQIWPDKFFFNTRKSVAAAADSLGAEGLAAAADSLGAEGLAAAADSLGAEGLAAAADSLGASEFEAPKNDRVETVPDDSTKSTQQEPTFDQDAIERPVLIIQDFFNAVIRDFPRTPFAIQAESTLDAIAELRLVSPDSLFVSDSLALATDSIGTRADSLGILSDSLGFAAMTDSLDVPARQDSTGQMAHRDSRKIVRAEVSDSVSVVGQYAGAAIQNQPGDEPSPPDAISRLKKALADSAAAARLSGVRGIPPPNKPAGRGLGSDSERAANPFLGDENVEFQESSVLRPLLTTGLPDEEATGWTFLLEFSRDIGSAQLARKRYEADLDSTGVRVLVLVGTERGQRKYIVAWGLFDAADELKSAIQRAREKLPEESIVLHMVPR